MAILTWKLELRNGRASAVSEHGIYVVSRDDHHGWNVEFTVFASRPGTVLRIPVQSFPSMQEAMRACDSHAEACAEWAGPSPASQP